jgi:threonyl-tRNA synthetase
VQAVGIPVAEAFADYLADVIAQMKKAGIRAELDASDDRMQKKVRNAQMQKVPFMVIAGEEDMAAGAVSFRYRNGEQKNGIPIKDAIAEIQKVVAERTQV